MVGVWPWVLFLLFVVSMLALDLGVFHRKAHVVKVKEAAVWVGVWMTLAVIFGAGLYVFRGPQAGLEFLTGYVIEQSLSVDNMFVFVLIFSFFAVPAIHQHRVLFWGILGALLMRGTMIGAGSALLASFHWVIYIFGGFLILTGVKMFLSRDEEIDPTKNPVLKLVRRVLPVTREFHGASFFVREAGKWAATPLFLVLVLVEITDLIFAVDSIPAIFAVTRDPFIVFTSNIFAILGLRSLYFLLSGAVSKFVYLKPALSAILTFVGVKMVIVEWVKIPILVSLGVIVTLLAIAIVASWIANRRQAREAAVIETSERQSGL